MQRFSLLLVRILLLALGLVAAAGVALLFVVLLALWSVRALWLRLTGRPPAPFVMRFGGAERFRRAWQQPARAAAADIDDAEVKRLTPR